MSDLVLKGLDVTNFRSIRGHIYAPLDAKVVLVYGENGAGKTSLLSAIELALTGSVQSLQRADPDYAKQLLHRSASDGVVVLKAVAGTAEQTHIALLNPNGVQSFDALPHHLATFFRERTFLPQSLLGQLLQIYQESGNDADSPLARFVGNLLGLDRLDALEAGLKPLGDVRNVRKIVDGWLAAENEKSRLETLLSDQRKSRLIAHEQIQTSLVELATICTALELSLEVREDTLDQVADALDGPIDSEALERLSDQQRRLRAIRREIDAARSVVQGGAPLLTTAPEDASRRFASWDAKHGPSLDVLRRRVEALLPDVSLPSDPWGLADETLSRLRTDQTQLADRAVKVRADIERHSKAQDECEIALQQRKTIDEEVGRLSSSAGSLASALAELTSFISTEICPVCDRDFSEVSDTPLGDHVHAKVRTLSASAERLLALGRSRSEVQVAIERLEREIEALRARNLGAETLANIDRRAAAIELVIAELDSLSETLREGGRLRAADVAARRVVSDVQSRHVTLAVARETLSAFAISVGAHELSEGESFEAAAARLEQLLAAEADRLQGRLIIRSRGANHIVAVRAALARRQEINARLAVDEASWRGFDSALERAQVLRDQGNAIRRAVDNVRSAIIRREFNSRLNRLWRDLFIRLAPGEPFVPAFRIPEAATQRLQPKLITEYRDGGEAGGTPGAMLSAANLNTAALTLFIALHLSVSKGLPWLILDDPVQSMDDVHIAHFAALLRTLSKEHGRQVIVAIHDRQLFEYLKLELSPAFSDDSLLTLELSRGPRRDSVCISKRFSFREETVLLGAA